MRRKETKRGGNFEASDDDGNVYRIMIYQEFHLINERGGTGRVAGQRFLRTDGGDHVNLIEKGKYELLDSMGDTTVIRSDDPNAPGKNE